MAAEETAKALEPPNEDYGIGLCVACCNELADGKRRTLPRYAVTLTPVPAGPLGALILPTCYPHLKGMSAGPGLITANGNLPRGRG